MESKLDSWNDPYGCRDVSLAEDVISELQDTIESQAAEIAELIDCLKDMEKGDDGHAWKVARRLIEKYGAES